MVVLTGKNLGERHRELNCKVAEVIANKISFNDIVMEQESSDIDKLYKIDVASQYKDVNYIVEILKSGDTLYISKVLKCQWLYHDDNSHIINPQNLHDNIFPFMSIKMKKKMLTTISMYIQNIDRAANFYVYCKNNRIPNIAFKFLIFSSEEFKLNVLKNENWHKLSPFLNNPINLQNFIGNSFVLADACIEMCNENNRCYLIHNLKYMYAFNNQKYLEFLEKYVIVKTETPNALRRLGIRISRSIILKHKNRVIDNPLLYVNILNKSILVKHTSNGEAKKYLSSLLPQNVNEFWEIKFCKAYDYIMNIVPTNEQFECIKQLFNTNYPGEPFEMTYNFYTLKYYNMMSIDERELWALHNIDNQTEILGSGNDYKWYKFVHIDKALIEIKKYVMITPDRFKRADLINMLVEATRNQNDLKKVLDYYYDRHINESEENKNSFIDKVLSVYNVFELNTECWEALNKLFYSLDIYTVGRYADKSYRAIAVACHILHNTDLPEALLDFIDLDVNYTHFRTLLEKLGEDKSNIVLQYLIKIFVDKLAPFDQDPSNKKLRKKLQKYVNNILDLLRCFGKEDEECPEIVKRFIEVNSPKPKKNKTVTAKDVLCSLKTDATLAINLLEHADLNIVTCRNIFNIILRKLKVYFHNDVAKEYINFLDRIIHKSLKESNDCHDRINVAIFGLIQLGDEEYKVSLMKKFQPAEPKINYQDINTNLLNIQQAICRYVGNSRPPVPLENQLQYIKGDYVQSCIPMFNAYLVNVTLPLVMKFTESLINAPMSIQKHGLRLAFQCYDTKNLITLLLNTWRKTKNISLRRIIYKSLYDKIKELKESEGDSEELKCLYEALKIFTSDLHQDDHGDLFDLICNTRLPSRFIDDYLQSAWEMIVKLPVKSVNIYRQMKIVKSIDRNIRLMKRDFVRKNIIDDYIHEILEQRQLQPDKLNDFDDLWDAKLNLVANYIIHYNDNKELEESLAFVSHIFKICVKMWHHKYEVFQKFYFDFIIIIENKIHDLWYQDSKDLRSIPVLKHILDMFLEALPVKEMYLIMWNLKLIFFIGESLSVTTTASYEEDGDAKPFFRREVVCDHIAKYIQQFIQELLAKQQFYSVFLSEIALLIKDKLTNYQFVLDMKNLDIIFSRSLANIELKETQLLALMILPTDVPKDMKEMHPNIVKKIKAFENDEVQSYLHFKFISPYNSRN